MKPRFWICLVALSIGLSSGAGARPAQLIITAGPFAKNITKNSALIVWYTTQKSTSTVVWGKTESYGKKSEGGWVSTHKVRLEGLSGGTTYDFRVISRAKDEEVRSENHSFTTPSADLSVRSAQFPSSLAVGRDYTVPVTTYLGAQPLDKPYTISIYRAAYSKEGLLLMENVKVGSAQAWPHNPKTFRTFNVPITLSVLKKGRRGLQEAFAVRNVFTVKVEAAEPEEDISNNQLSREVPVTH